MIGDVFTKNGVASLTTMGEYTGRRDITNFFDNSFYPAMDLVLHMGHNPRIQLTSDTTARASFMYEVYILTKGSTVGVWLGGLYKDEYEVEDGRWLIKSLSGGYYFNTTSTDIPWVRDRFCAYPPGSPPLPEEYRIVSRA